MRTHIVTHKFLLKHLVLRVKSHVGPPASIHVKITSAGCLAFFTTTFYYTVGTTRLIKIFHDASGITVFLKVELEAFITDLLGFHLKCRRWKIHFP